MLSDLDYRAALLQAYKAMRYLKGPIYSYEYAKAIIKPLPDDRKTAQLRIAFNAYTRVKSFYNGPDRDPKLCWSLAWRYAREYLNP